MFKFIHTADVHLDSPLKSLSLRNPDVAELVGGATRRTFEKVIDLCIDEEVNALLISGDLYDGDQTCRKTAALLEMQLLRLKEANIQVFIILGNHDFESQLKKIINYPDNVHVFDGRGGVVKLSEYGVAIHGVSYSTKHVPNLLHKYHPPEAGFVNIGMMHTSLGGPVEHDEYAPCSVNDLVNQGYDYWALGHIHTRQVYSSRPHIVMPGIPQGRSIAEFGTKSVTMVTVFEDNIEIKEVITCDIEFKRIVLDLTNVERWEDMLSKLKKCLHEASLEAEDRYVVCRVILSGKTPLYWRLHRDSDRLAIQAREHAQTVGHIFIEDCDYQIENAEACIDSADPINELEALMKQSCLSPALLSRATTFLESAIKKLPPKLRDSYGQDSVSEEQVSNMVRAGTIKAMAELKGLRQGTEG